MEIPHNTHPREIPHNNQHLGDFPNTNTREIPLTQTPGRDSPTTKDILTSTLGMPPYHQHQGKLFSMKALKS